MTITKKQLFNYFKEENNNFSFEDFFNDEKSDERGIIVITPNQIIKARNIMFKNTYGRSGHDVTYDYLTRLLYNISFSKNGEMNFDENEVNENKNAIDYLQYQQNLMIRMCNEGVNHLKLIWVHLPLKITKIQFELLKGLNVKTKNLFEKISNKNGDSLIGFIDNVGKKIYGDSLDCVIKYLNENNMVENYDYIINENYIIGDTLDQIKRNYKG